MPLLATLLPALISGGTAGQAWAAQQLPHHWDACEALQQPLPHTRPGPPWAAPCLGHLSSLPRPRPRPRRLRHPPARAAAAAPAAARPAHARACISGREVPSCGPAAAPAPPARPAAAAAADALRLAGERVGGGVGGGGAVQLL